MVSLWKIFWIFAKIGAFTIGGGIPMIAAIKSELIERGWLNDEDFVDIIALAQTAPGLFAANIAILTGHKLRMQNYRFAKSGLEYNFQAT